MNSYSLVLYQLCWPSLESPCHCDLIALLFIYAACQLLMFEKYKIFFFFFDEVFLILVPLVHCWQLCLIMFLPLLIMAPPGALLSVCLQLHWFFFKLIWLIWGQLPPLLFFKLPLTSLFLPGFFVVCNGHMTPSSLLLHHLLDPMVWYFLELLAMSTLPFGWYSQ